MNIKSATFLLSLLSLTACGGGSGIGMAYTTALMYATKPNKPPPADQSTQVAEHDSWCYRTIGDPECFTQPQLGHGGQLITVEPENKRPLTQEAYNKAALAIP